MLTFDVPPQVWTVYLGSDSPPSIRVVHQSLSGREHTFCVETSKRSFYLACRSDLELNRWIDRSVFFSDVHPHYSSLFNYYSLEFVHLISLLPTTFDILLHIDVMYNLGIFQYY